MNIESELSHLRGMTEGIRERIHKLEEELKKEKLPFQKELDVLTSDSTYKKVAQVHRGLVEVRRSDGDSITIDGRYIRFKPGVRGEALSCSRETIERVLRLSKAMQEDC